MDYVLDAEQPAFLPILKRKQVLFAEKLPASHHVFLNSYAGSAHALQTDIAQTDTMLIKELKRRSTPLHPVLATVKTAIFCAASIPYPLLLIRKKHEKQQRIFRK